ncbi:DUF6504 family protein [Nocardiopsis ansamitocini]|uniref:DUF6504 family protein n=1 Tax=Nocardiopsis ansamitocini TaxID=1670832 RepID=UPI0032DB44AA
MARVYGVPVRVWEHGGRPARFVWEGRVYVVQRIIDHWVTPRSGAASAKGQGPTARSSWRVQAGAGAASGHYELSHDSVSGAWLLARVAE